ncbi:gamma-tubulin complex component protein [Pseudomassariella vexata]|uniref:Spindle pole body component n=1 Tax=Pseudomassariella vexata TaxID=1141098 RepID=A0A1Y2DV57_9PEZI|nr:gamma-tubulin complex component protein [Pseudomassariella vexata]ORY63127.1 gamma-tubulin complex component protein [Pseudomassariella vexata]
MLHEILLSLSGHPSPLLQNDHAGSTALSAPERNLLRSAGQLSEIHCNLISYTAQVSATHPSAICRAVSTAITSTHLAAFQRKILEVEDGILRKDAGLVGAYNIVPLTAVMGEFSGWTRTMQWLWDVVQFMLGQDSVSTRRGSELINKLRSEMQTGYADIEDASTSLVKVAETAWLKQVSAWILYGRIPNFGGDDFFIQRDKENEQGYKLEPALLPSFVSASTASSMLFIGTSLNRVRTRSVADPSIGTLAHLSSQLQELSSLKFPLNTAAFSRTIISIRMTLSRTILQKLLPLEKVIEMLHLLRDFLLLGRGEFAMALTQQADERIRGRWRRADNLAYEQRSGVGNVVVKEGEVTAVLARTFAALGSMQSQHAEEDEELELARDLLRLNLSKSKTATPKKPAAVVVQDMPTSIVTTPFRNLLFSVPVDMTIQIPSPLDLFLTTSDVQTYTMINSYLLSIRRAHLRLTDLWKVTSLRRHHPAPPRPPFNGTRGGRETTRTLRERWSARSAYMRSAWTTSSAGIFFLAETEAYLQVEVVGGLWGDFHSWLTGRSELSKQGSSSRPPTSANNRANNRAEQSDNDDYDVWPQNKDQASRPSTSSRIILPKSPHRDPQTLSTAHRAYLRVLIRRLLLTQASFTETLYNLLIHIDHLVAFIHRLHGIWTSMDLEMDEGVVDAFSNLDAEEADLKANIRHVEDKVKKGIEEVVGVLRSLSMDSAFMAEMEDEQGGAAGGEEMVVVDGGDEERYVPKRIGGVDRLLMKLDFGGWFDVGRAAEGCGDEF